MATPAARLFIALGAVSAALAVAAGAFGAHALAESVSPDGLVAWKTGASYHLIHALALVAVGIVLSYQDGRLVRIAGWLFLAGMVLFSGSLYALVLTGLTVLGPITPLGGVAFMGGWLSLAVGVYRHRGV